MIRAATVQDAKAIAQIWNPWIRDSIVTFNPVEKSTQDIEHMIETRQASGHAVLLCCDNQALQGFVTYSQFRAGSGYSSCMEHTIILARASHGKGIGRALMTAIEAHAKAAGAHQMIGGISAENTIARLNDLRASGFALSLDDFGTGFSSLSYLKRFPLDELKIDRSFVADLTKGGKDAAIALSIIELGRQFGMHVVAEGVETRAQASFLLAHGCPIQQGYLYSQPLPLDRFEALLRNGGRFDPCLSAPTP